MNNSPIKSSCYDDQHLTSNWIHRALFASGCTTLLITLFKSISLIASTGSLLSWLHLLFAAVMGYLMADLGNGFYHWSIDNYGSPENPVFGFQVDTFLLHHIKPTAITKIEFARHHYIPAAVITVVVIPINVVSNNPMVLMFVCVLASGLMFSLQIHAWAHTPKPKLPKLVVELQDAGLFVSGTQHAAHHKPPHNNNYCSVSGVWNRFMDRFRVFFMLEVVIFKVLGIKPRSWKHLTSE